MTWRSLLAACCLGLGAAGARAQAPAVEDIDRRLKIVERNLSLQQEAAAEKAKNGATVSVDRYGFFLKAANGGFAVRFGGMIQADGRWFIDKEGTGLVDQFLVRRARLSMEGTVHDIVDFRVMPDFGNGQTLVFDAYVDFKLHPAARLRLGKMKPPVGLERWQSANAVHFIERGFPTFLAPNRDVGVLLHGQPWEGTLHYGVGVFNGVIDNGNVDGDVDNSKDAVARFFLFPFKRRQHVLTEELGFGVAGSWGRQRAGALPVYRAPSQSTIFQYAGGTSADGARWRVAPQAYWYPGSFGFLAEHTTSVQEVRSGPNKDVLRHRGWQVVGSWVVTGEKNSFNGVSPRRPVNLAEGAWGAWELVGRYGELRIDDHAFPVYASAAGQTRGAQSGGAGVNWYPNAGVKVMANYEDTALWGGGTRDRERSVYTRVQLLF